MGERIPQHVGTPGTPAEPSHAGAEAFSVAAGWHAHRSYRGRPPLDARSRAIRRGDAHRQLWRYALRARRVDVGRASQDGRVVHGGSDEGTPFGVGEEVR